MDARGALAGPLHWDARRQKAVKTRRGCTFLARGCRTAQLDAAAEEEDDDDDDDDQGCEKTSVGGEDP